MEIQWNHFADEIKFSETIWLMKSSTVIDAWHQISKLCKIIFGWKTSIYSCLCLSVCNICTISYILPIYYTYTIYIYIKYPSDLIIIVMNNLTHEVKINSPNLIGVLHWIYGEWLNICTNPYMNYEDFWSNYGLLHISYDDQTFTCNHNPLYTTKCTVQSRMSIAWMKSNNIHNVIYRNA